MKSKDELLKYYIQYLIDDIDAQLDDYYEHDLDDSRLEPFDNTDIDYIKLDAKLSVLELLHDFINDDIWFNIQLDNLKRKFGDEIEF